MKNIRPNELLGARTYFTGFDSKSYVIKDKVHQKKILERTLKVLLLTKNKIVFGASHLKNDLAIDLVHKEPILFEKGLIIPALKNELKGDLKRATNNANFDHNLFSNYVGWNLEDNTSWFKEQIKNGFVHEKSLLRNNILYTSSEDLDQIIDIFNNSDYSARGEISKEIPNYLHKDDLKSFNMYQNLIYNISGARVVNCESSLNQENMIFDYSVADIENRKIVLSDVEIFHRMFVEQILNTMTKNNSLFNLYFIDSLSFKDIIDLREKIENTNFISKYNELITKSSNLIEKKDFIDLYSLEELLSISDNIHKNFKSDIEKEALKYLKSKNEYQQERVIFEPIYNIIKSINPIDSLVDRSKNLIYLTRNIYNKIVNNEQKDEYLNHINYQNKLAQDMIKSTQIENGTSLVEVFKLLRDYNYEKYERF